MSESQFDTVVKEHKQYNNTHCFKFFFKDKGKTIDEYSKQVDEISKEVTKKIISEHGNIKDIELFRVYCSEVSTVFTRPYVIFFVDNEIAIIRTPKRLAVEAATLVFGYGIFELAKN